MGVVAKRSSMTFYSNGEDHYSHRVRIVLAEKGVAVEVVDCEVDDLPEDVAALNPYNSLPTLLDRDLVLYEPNVMMEYLDERFPHPPLLPVYPVARAESRLFVYRIEKDWAVLVDAIQSSRSDNVVKKSVKELKESLVAVAPIFMEKPFFMSEEFSLVDCCVAPILWRLPSLGVDIRPSKQSKPLIDYMDRLFNREAFQESLSVQEREMRS